ncbi:MAG: flagellar basal-body rod protein FlgF [Oscillospiraceae bacterium]|jgi:flagellar basal-body rod protein FlgG|nr:flagellar basal-body rod protein FlgF [Oscillospiraceae bacterium]
MVRGLYIAGTGMMLQRRRMETITNNVANADTIGFKKEHFVSHSFDEVLTRRINDYSPRGGLNQIVGPLNLGTQLDYLYIDFDQGSLEATDMSTDLALVGDGFFVVQTADGERYTKTGHFYLSSTGYLMDSEANLLLGENGPIYVGNLDFTVDQNGRVFSGQNYIDTIRVVSFADNTTLRRQGSNLFFATVPPEAQTNPYNIMQGFLEGSNVDIAREMVDMLAMYRTYETNQRIVTMIDETVGRAVNEIGRIR